MQMRSPVILASVALAVGISACGSSTKSSSVTASPVQTLTQRTTSTPSPTPEGPLDAAFIARANRVCARARSRLAERGQFPYRTFNPLHPDITLLPKVAAFFAATRSVSDRLPIELRDLGIPRKAAGLWGQVILLAQQGRSIADRQIKAAEASNAAEFVATVIGVEAIGGQLGQKAITAGFAGSSPCRAIL